jgi:hypothetical protein
MSLPWGSGQRQFTFALNRCDIESWNEGHMKTPVWVVRQSLTARFIEIVLTLIFARVQPVGAAEDSLNPPFSIQQQGQQSWLVKPNGDRFFSLGVCCVNQGSSTKEWDPANPSYAAWQHFNEPNTWAITTLRR